MGFNPIFYAGSTKLSDVTIDSDLNMGGRNISGVDTLHVSRLGSPYRPETWPTEEIVIEPHDVGETVSPTDDNIQLSLEFAELFSFHTPNSAVSRIWTMVLAGACGTGSGTINVTADGVLIYENLNLPFNTSGTTFTLDLPGNSEVVVSGKRNQAEPFCLYKTSWYRYEGTVGRVIDLTGKWLAHGLDMQGLAATVKIQGVDVPYLDYAKYFPLAPSELKLPADWYDSDPLPIVEVYS